MSGPASFQDLLGRARAGDEQAAAELVRRYEPAIRRAARLRLRDSRLGRILDSMDICQSVLASFFVRNALGQYDLDTPEQLLRLLATMTRNKLVNQMHRQRAARRDLRRVAAGIEAVEVAADHPGPSSLVAARELLQEARRRLSPEELQLLERRERGDNWAAIAAELDGNPETLRKRLNRAIDRVAHQIGLDEPEP
jgi:RNA polymerase sigma-70 factor (ECF subfamily)